MPDHTRPLRAAYRTRHLDEIYHRDYVWCADTTRLLYRYERGRWEICIDGVWQACEHSNGMPCFWVLRAEYGETFIRIAEKL